jgi:RsiW-degrading membrane proteinase PrsW (M82 family)
MSFDLSLWKTIAIFVVISFIPILGWIYFFQSQNFEKKKYVIITFIAGMLSIVPIKLYEKYWDFSVWYLEHLNLFEYFNDIVDSATIIHFMSFLLVSIIVAFFMFIFSALIMFIPEIFSRDNTLTCYRNKIEKISESPFIFVTIGALFGIIAVVLSLFFPEKVWFFVVVGMLEEFAKYLMLRFADENKIGSISDAISFSIIIALGFAFVENVVYISKFWLSSEQTISTFTAFFILRSTISVIAHVCFSAIVGYFYGIAHFSEQIYAEESQEKQHFILRKIHQIFHLKVAPLFHEEKLFEGLLLAMFIHAIFNSLLEFELVVLVIPFIIGIFILILNLLHRRDNHICRGNIKTICHIS